MDNIIVIKHEPLNILKIKHNSLLLDYLSLLHIDEDDISDDINTGDYKCITLQVNNDKIYTLLHGFPGDAPVGCILLDNDVFIELVEYPTNVSNNIELICKWYFEITYNLCIFDNDFWY